MPSSRGLPEPGIELASLMSPALAGVWGGGGSLPLAPPIWKQLFSMKNEPASLLN